MAAALQFPFTSAQWKELERQAMIYKYMMASIPVPPDLLFPLTTNFSAEFSTTSSTAGWADLYGWRYSSSSSTSNSKDAEPGRCKRTDGKKWRCSRDVAPNQKYCERHMHRGRPRSRKHVEVQPLVSETNTNKKIRLNNTTLNKNNTSTGQPSNQQMVETNVQSNGTNHVIAPKMNTDLSIKTFENRGVNWVMEDKELGIEGIEQQWSTFMNQKIDNHPSLFPQQFEGEGLNLLSYTDSTAVRDVNLTHDESPSLTLSMAMAAGNIIDGEMEKIQEGGCDFRSKDSIFLSTNSWIPFGSGGGPLAEMLHTGTVSATPSKPASPYTGNGDSISPLVETISSSPSGVQHRAFFTQSDNSMCNVAFPLVTPSEVVPFQWLN